MKKSIALFLAMCILFALAVPSFAVDLEINESGGQQNIPVKITAEATMFDVTVPTDFPIEVDEEGGVTTGKTASITNNSFGAIYVSNITVTDNASDNGDTADWHLADYDTDMSKEMVDANKIGLSVTPDGGVLKVKEKSAYNPTALTTVTGSTSEQTLLSGYSEEWVIGGANEEDDSDVLTVVYDANASAVSSKITDKTVAHIVITVAWYTDAATKA